MKILVLNQMDDYIYIASGFFLFFFLFTSIPVDSPSITCEPSIVTSKEHAAAQERQHKDPRTGTVGRVPFADQADTSPPEFCKAVKTQTNSKKLAFSLDKII